MVCADAKADRLPKLLLLVKRIRRARCFSRLAVVLTLGFRPTLTSSFRLGSKRLDSGGTVCPLLLQGIYYHLILVGAVLCYCLVVAS